MIWGHCVINYCYSKVVLQPLPPKNKINGGVSEWARSLRQAQDLTHLFQECLNKWCLINGRTNELLSLSTSGVLSSRCRQSLVQVNWMKDWLFLRINCPYSINRNPHPAHTHSTVTESHMYIHTHLWLMIPFPWCRLILIGLIIIIPNMYHYLILDTFLSS